LLIGYATGTMQLSAADMPSKCATPVLVSSGKMARDFMRRIVTVAFEWDMSFFENLLQTGSPKKMLIFSLVQDVLFGEIRYAIFFAL
jgi:hypothetical protein